MVRGTKEAVSRKVSSWKHNLCRKNNILKYLKVGTTAHIKRLYGWNKKGKRKTMLRSYVKPDQERSQVIQENLHLKSKAINIIVFKSYNNIQTL